MKISALFKSSFLSTFLRFDLAVICCVALTGHLLFPDIISFKFKDAPLILSCGALWFIAAALITESLSLPRWCFYALSLPIFGGLAYHVYHLLQTHTESWSIGVIMLGLILLIFIAPFVAKRSDPDDVWSFQFDLLKHGIVAGVAGVILTLGIYLLLFALYYLLSITFYASIYLDIFIIIAGFVFPITFMAGIPTSFEDTSFPSTGSTLLKLLTYILIPLLIVYGIILHAYSLKIMITQALPRGKVAYLVAGFETFTLIAYTLTQRWKENHTSIRLFHRYIGWFMLVPLTLMAWGIWERVSVFGLTEARYFVVLLWVWFTACTIIILLRISNTTLWIYGMLSGLMLVCSIGCWGISELPIKQQIHRLSSIVLQVRSSKNKSSTLKHRLVVSSILDYLSARNRLMDVHHLYLNPSAIILKDTLTAKNVGVELGVPYIEQSARSTQSGSYSRRYKATINSLPIQGYTHIIPNITLSEQGKLSQSFDVKGVGSFKVAYLPKTQSFEITRGELASSPIYQIQLPNLLYALAKNSNNTLFTNSALTTQVKKGITIQVVFTGVTTQSDTDNTASIDNISEISCIILIKDTSKQ